MEGPNLLTEGPNAMVKSLLRPFNLNADNESLLDDFLSNLGTGFLSLVEHKRGVSCPAMKLGPLVARK